MGNRILWWILGYAACASATFTLGAFPLESVVVTATAAAGDTPLLSPFGLSKASYLPRTCGEKRYAICAYVYFIAITAVCRRARLPILLPARLRILLPAVIHSIVTFLRRYQTASGDIANNFSLTPGFIGVNTYAHASSVLVASGYDTTLFDSSALALDKAITQWSKATCEEIHTACNFYGIGVMTAFLNLRHDSRTTAARLAKWEAGLAAVNPSVAYIKPAIK